MKHTRFQLLLTLLMVLSLAASSLTAQVSPRLEKYRKDQLGTVNENKGGIMDGNLVRTLFYNYTMIAYWPFSPSGEWPKGTGVNYVDGICMIVAAEATSPRRKAPNNKLQIIETNYREEMDITTSITDPQVVNEPWGWNPIGGYASNFVDPVLGGNPPPAMSNQQTSWPSRWPDALDLSSSFNGQWNGYFGRNIFNADLETFFVVDDSKDAEFTFVSRGGYYPLYKNNPDADMSIYEGYTVTTTDTIRYPGGIKPDAARQWYNPNIRKGLGLRVETRGFQWSHILAEDMMFWHYDIISLADSGYSKTYFGFYTDTGLGGDADNGDDWASYDTELDITYGFDRDGKTPANLNIRLGIYGYAYLESPGNSSDGINNDGDVDKFGAPMIDERRDDGIDNDGDWQPFIDENGNGIWDWDQDAQFGEALLNDVGRDGAGPFDEPYDEETQTFKTHFPDEGEGDGKPTDGEPNFDRLDKDESDQIGLTAVAIEKLDGKTPRDLWPKNDDIIWARMSSNVFDTSVQNSNIQIVFSSGPFLLRGATDPAGFGQERFSMALAFANDYRDLAFNKKTVQLIYNFNYNFTKPPLKPRMNAVAGDGQVTLYWDKRAESSVDPVLGYEDDDPKKGPKKDFEGYLVYRSTEPEFGDIKVITDSQGDAKYWKPIAQFDKVDGIFGPDPVGINGASFWRGDETGLQHSYVDRDVQNGRKYFYAVSAYDQGAFIDSVDLELQPTETTKIITTDLVGNIKFVDQNCAVVTPQAPVAGYQNAQISTTDSPDFGSGPISASVIDPDATADNAIYTLEFESTIPTEDKRIYETTGAFVIRDSLGVIDTLGSVLSGDVVNIPMAEASTQEFDGIIVTMVNDTTTTINKTGSQWISGDVATLPYLNPYKTPTTSLAGPKYTDRYRYMAGDYEIRFYDTMVDTSLSNQPGNNFTRIPVNFRIKNLQTGLFVRFETEIKDSGRTELVMGKDRIFIIERSWERNPADPINYIFVDKWPMIIDYGQPGDDLTKKKPGAGDVFVARVNKRFFKGDRLTFKVSNHLVNQAAAKSEMNRIKVVPNPYISTSLFEPRNLEGVTGRGERKIMFTHLPQTCTVRIYNMAGTLVKTLRKESDIQEGNLSWNLLSEDGTDVAYGVYVFHVDAPGVGEKIGKFALIK